LIVTNLEGGRAKYVCERLYCPCGQAENHIKAWKNHLAADRTSCHAAEASRALDGLDARKMPLHLDTGKGKP
jgi:hypothetical protein